MHNMVSSLLLLTLLIVPSTQAIKLEELADWLEVWRKQSLAQYMILKASLIKVEAEAVDVEEQLETLLADFILQSTDIRELLTIVGVTQNATSQILAELDTLRGR